MRTPGLLALSVALALLSGCKSQEAAPDGPAPPAAPAEIQALLEERCVECHSPPKAAAQLSLEGAEGSYAALVGQPSRQVPTMKIVEPGRPEQSYLLLKLEGGFEEAGGKGVLMPKKDDALGPAEVEAIERWIASLGQ